MVFAHKTTEGWEALLSGIIRGGLTITASWPITTELAIAFAPAIPLRWPEASTLSAARAPPTRALATGAK